MHAGGRQKHPNQLLSNNLTLNTQHHSADEQCLGRKTGKRQIKDTTFQPERQVDLSVMVLTVMTMNLETGILIQSFESYICFNSIAQYWKYLYIYWSCIRVSVGLRSTEECSMSYIQSKMYKLTTYFKNLPQQSVSSKRNLQVVDKSEKYAVSCFYAQRINVGVWVFK